MIVDESQRSHLAALAERFERFAFMECRGVSPLYERLSLGVAADSEMLTLAARVRAGQPVPNLFLAAVHFLLLGGAGETLAGFYPSVGGAYDGAADPYPAFRSFCFQYRAAIIELIGARLVQTNEVRRCACLLPALGIAAARSGRPLALIEVGASAGLNLLWDRYGYDYAGRRAGDPLAPVQLACDVRGAAPPLPASMPAVVSRVGLDLHPIDVRDAEAVSWLRALVWPDEPDRADLLLRAVDVARREPPPLIAGDALDLLPGVLAAVPPTATPCVVHTHTVNQFSPEARQQLADLLATQGQGRNLYRISIEAERGLAHPVLRMTAYENGAATERALARCDAHGEWIEWTAGPEPFAPETGG